MELPKLKNPVNTEKISLSLDPDLKKRLEDLKWKKRVNVSEWMRMLLRRELDNLDQAS